MEREYGTGSVHDRPIGEVLGDLLRNAGQLIRQEFELARVETQQNLSRLLRDSVMLIIGAVFGYVGLLALVAAVILGLATVLPAWASALIVGGALLLIGLILVFANLNAMRNADVMPQQTIETLREDVRMMKEKFT